MPSTRSIGLLMLLATAHVSLVPASIAALSDPASPHFLIAGAIALFVTQIGLLTVWLNLATLRALPLCCVVAAVAMWGIGLVPLVGFRALLHCTALLMTQVFILVQLQALCFPADYTGQSRIHRGKFQLQFSLRTLMVAALVVCVLLGYPQWLATLRGARLPVLSITVATGVLLAVLLLIGTLRGARLVIPAWLFLLALTAYVVRESVEVRPWWELTKPGYIAEVALVLTSVLVVRVAGWRVTEFKYGALLKKGARLGRRLLPATQPQSAAP